MTTETLGAAMSGGLAAHHALQAFAHALDVGPAHLRKERQRDGLPRDALRDREHALAESLVAEQRGEVDRFVGDAGADAFLMHRVHERLAGAAQRLQRQQHREHVHGDRKSTRLNSSHGSISYAVFCLKKKNKRKKKTKTK